MQVYIPYQTIILPPPNIEQPYSYLFIFPVSQYIREQSCHNISLFLLYHQANIEYTVLIRLVLFHNLVQSRIKVQWSNSIHIIIKKECIHSEQHCLFYIQRRCVYFIRRIHTAYPPEDKQ